MIDCIQIVMLLPELSALRKVGSIDSWREVTVPQIQSGHIFALAVVPRKPKVEDQLRIL